jgi:hypothetical protein
VIVALPALSAESVAGFTPVTFATVVSELVQVHVAQVDTLPDPSVIDAVNVRVAPFVIVSSAGNTCRTGVPPGGSMTVIVREPVTVPFVAVIVATPALSADSCAGLAPVTLATVVSELVHVHVAHVDVLPDPSVIDAVSVRSAPLVIVSSAGNTCRAGLPVGGVI